MNYALNRLAIRLGMLGVALTSGTVAVHQAQKGLQPSDHDSQQIAANGDNFLSSASGFQSTSPQGTQMPIPIPGGTSREPANWDRNTYSNEVVDYAGSAPAPPYDDSIYGEVEETAQAPAQSHLSQSVAPSTYDMPGNSSPGNEAAYHDEVNDQYSLVQQVQAELAEDDGPPPPLTAGTSVYPDVHDGVNATPPRPLPVIPAGAEELASNPFDFDDEPPATTVSNETSPPAIAHEQHDTLDTDGAIPPPSDSQYRGDVTLRVPDSTGASSVAGHGVSSNDDFFGGVPAPSVASVPGESITPSATGNGQPGPEELIGLQTPSLTIRKSAPTEAQVGKPTRLETVVRNVGKVSAHDVLIRDEVPRGTRLIDTTPAAGATADGAVLWQVGTIEPDSEVTVSMNVMPLEEGEIGSVATISFQVAATSRSIVTKPVLTLEHTGPEQVLVGGDVVFQIRLANTGTGVASNVHLEEDVPEGLKHFDGRELEFRIGTLKPGESRILELKLTADKPGVVRNTLIARGDSKLRVQDDYEFEVVAPDLQLEMDGPRKRFLDRKAQYQISIANPGTAPAKNVEMVAKLPPSLKFVSANNAGYYDSNRHAVTWSLEALPPKEMGTVELTVLPVQMGRFPLRVDAKANMNLADSVTYDMEIEGMAALLYTVTDVNDPIEVGGETTYEIQIINQGSKASTNLQLGAMVPSGMEMIRGDGPARSTIDGQRIVFDPLPRLAPQADVSYRIFVRGVEPGDKRIQVKLKSDDLSEPVTKEESTHVYSDG